MHLSRWKKTLAERSADLESRSARVEELEELLASRERAAEALRKRLERALLGFEGRGLKVEQRNGKVYVSLEAELLFPSGSAEVDDKGGIFWHNWVQSLRNKTVLKLL